MEAPYRIIDQSSWPRRRSYEYYRTFENQLFNLTVEIEAAAVHRLAGQRRCSFFLAMLYPILTAVNCVPSFRQRIIEPETVIEFERVAVLTPILGADDLFTMALIERADSFGTFLVAATAAVERARNGIFDPAVRQRRDYFCASCIPWFSFTALSNAALSRRQSIAIFSWGKMNAGGRIPLALQLNHALIDARQGACFLDALTELLNTPESWLAPLPAAPRLRR